MLPVSDCCQSTALSALNRKSHGICLKAHGTQHNINSSDISLPVAEKKQGACHCCFGQCHSDEWCPNRSKGIAFFLFPKLKQRYEDCKAWIIACGRPHDQILDRDLTHMVCPCQARGRNTDVSIAWHQQLTVLTISLLRWELIVFTPLMLLTYSVPADRIFGRCLLVRFRATDRIFCRQAFVIFSSASPPLLMT